MSSCFSSELETATPDTMSYDFIQTNSPTDAFFLKGIRYDVRYQDTSTQSSGNENWFLEFYKPTGSFKAFCQPGNQVSVSSSVTFRPHLASNMYFRTERLLVYFEFEDTEGLANIWIQFDEALTYDRFMAKVCLTAPNVGPIHRCVLLVISFDSLLTFNLKVICWRCLGCCSEGMN